MSTLHQGGSVLYESSNNDGLPAFSFVQSSSNKPGISFALGTGLVVLIILFVSALFSFFYHWLSLRKLGTSTTTDSPHWPPPPEAASDHNSMAPTSIKLEMLQCPPVVYMAGEKMPRFIAFPCPVESALQKTASSAEDKEVRIPIDSLAKRLDIRL